MYNISAIHQGVAVPAPFAADQTAVRQVVVEAAARRTPNLAALLQERFGISRPTANNYVRALVREGLIVRAKRGVYELGRAEFTFSHGVDGLEEHAVWAGEIQPVLKALPPNVIDIWHYGCTEMINNVIDHAESRTLGIAVRRSAQSVEISIADQGVGIFRKIAKALALEDDRHAVLELSKGKITTDPARHTGEGIFFSSRAFDSFRILSGGVFFQHEARDGEDWILGEEHPKEPVDGTLVIMGLDNHATRTLQSVFDAYATDTVDYRFDRTVVPVKLLQYGDDRLVSRSQAKRLLARFDRFRTVVLDFEDVESIGQAFADEVFRVFTAEHPKIELLAINTNEQVARMMNRAVSERQPQADLFAGR
jgi:DNA-binding Lrp family transcriptional regulator